MCAIVDANVAHQVFGDNRPEAGVEFFKWINKERGRLVAGGKLLEELDRTPAREWARQAMIAGWIRNINNDEVDARAGELENQGLCRSDDSHILALAQVSGARLLYTNDGTLLHDFKSKNLIDQPRGKVYSTRKDYGRLQDSHKKLLQRKDLCRFE